ncbi:putative metallophosphoesterase [Sinorhizobium phage phiM6]|nr:putative metallophosphoesterase [Sinorhizobium phage phiM6]
MAKNIWVISDTHFQHHNIITYCDRPFKTPREMDEHMIDKWNSVVKEGDKVYHLGDVYMGHWEGAEKIFKRLNGQKRLILGNHDNGKDQVLQRYFKKIEIWRMFPEFGLLLTHVPVHKSALYRGMKNRPTDLTNVMLEDQGTYLKNIHGHIHNRESPSVDHRNVSVEMIGYKPINIEELRIW